MSTETVSAHAAAASAIAAAASAVSAAAQAVAASAQAVAAAAQAASGQITPAAAQAAAVQATPASSIVAPASAAPVPAASAAGAGGIHPVTDDDIFCFNHRKPESMIPKNAAAPSKPQPSRITGVFHNIWDNNSRPLKARSRRSIANTCHWHH